MTVQILCFHFYDRWEEKPCDFLFKCSSHYLAHNRINTLHSHETRSEVFTGYHSVNNCCLNMININSQLIYRMVKVKKNVCACTCVWTKTLSKLLLISFLWLWDFVISSFWSFIPEWDRANIVKHTNFLLRRIFFFSSKAQLKSHLNPCAYSDAKSNNLSAFHLPFIFSLIRQGLISFLCAESSSLLHGH